ncbi:rho GTPase-activating protein 45 [Neomonachus schauinslandi]|uniref:Rho GTPase-activating protein 45 n=1 Tax=Neomonachus schauinslandi TaxID=29088 RepID=A0A2Y9IB57_NEOSC|nr:rho GTPase-activating protein 45 [Neomonachus schauinslandi]
MFSRKKRELMKTPSISKKNRAGSPSPQPAGELPRKDGADAVSLGPSLEPPSAASNAKAMGTLKRPTSLSRHASAAGFPLSGASSWTLGRGHRSPLTTASPAELPIEGPCPDTVEDISQLLTDVGRFAKALEKLKECVLSDDLLEARRPLAHEYLGEALRMMRQIISKYPLLNTVESLTAAGTLIAKIRAFHYECNKESDKQEFEKALETIALSFSNTVSEFLMGEVDSSTLLIVEVEQDNKMTPGNLGIVFGPTLLRPRPTEATVSLSSLVDYPHQARVVETLIAHYGLIFEEEPEEVPGGQDGTYVQRAEATVQTAHPEASAGAALPLQEEAADRGPEPQVASNDSDSEAEEASDLLSPADGGAVHRLSFLEKPGSEASVEEGQGSRSGSEEQLGAAAAAGEGLAQQLSEYNTNQCNNTAEVRLPAMRLRGGRVEAGSGQERQPDCV